MNLFAALLAFGLAPLSARDLAPLAEARDVEGLQRMTAPGAVPPLTGFQFLRLGGVYGGGRAGWSTVDLADPVGGKRYVVFSTPILCEDIGEQVFELGETQILREVDELDDFGLRLTHHDFHLRLDPKTATFHFKTTSQFRAKGALRPSFHLRIGPEFKVSSVKDASGKPVPFAQAGGTISVARPAGNAFALTFEYSATITDKRGPAQFQPNEALLSGACWWPSLARQASTSKATITSPATWRAFTHGTRTSEKIEGDQRVTTWNNALPISVFSLAAGEYTVVQERIGKFTLWSASTVEGEETLRLQNRLNAPIVAFLDTLSPWPYPAWGSLISPLFEDGGLEAYSFATYQQGWLPEVEPHEPAHTLWGGVIPNTYLRSLWNESLASFFENYYLREGLPGNRADLRRAFRELPRALPIYRDQAAITAGAESGSSALPIGYGRGGKVLDMLEHEIGEDAMREAMKLWLREHKQGNTGEWEDFERAVVRAAGRDVRWFFDQWLRRPGWPEFEVAEVSREQLGNRWVISANVRFDQAPYRLRFDALVRFADGKEQWVRLPLTAGRSTERLRVEVGAEPVAITLDPWLRIMRGLGSDALAPSLARVKAGGRSWVRQGDDAMADRLLDRRPRQTSREFPTNLNRLTLVADPRRSAEARALLRKLSAPPAIQGNRVVWRGQAVDLNRGGFAAVIELGDNQRCVLMFGTTRLMPILGEADAVLFDEFGRPLAATRRPSRSGALHFPLNSDAL